MPENRVSKRVIDTVLGQNNILLVVPHALDERGNGTMHPLQIFGRHLARQLRCYAIINNKYHRRIADMADIRVLRSRKKLTNDFLLRIRQFKDEICDNNLLPMMVIVQSGDQKNLSADILLGYGQGERNNPHRPHRPTIGVSVLSKLRLALEDQGLSTQLAPLDSDLCGRESYSLNQLFRQKNHVDGFYDPLARSLLLTISEHLIEHAEQAKWLAEKVQQALLGFVQTMSIVRKVALNTIDTVTAQDLKYIFRIHGKDALNDLYRETYIDELARSIEKNGLLHPLVLLQKKDGRYKILCGFRRHQAIRRLGWQWVEAKVYGEDEFDKDDFFEISLAENTKRRNLNPVEIGNFLESAARELGLNNALLAERFGQSLGIGQPGKRVSQSTIHKYRKINKIRESGESAAIISDLINDQLSFAIAAEVLAPIQNAAERDAIYLDVVKPLSPTRPQLVKIIKLLRQKFSSLRKALENQYICDAVDKASRQSQKAQAFIRYLERWPESRDTRYHRLVEQVATSLRAACCGDKASKRDLHITSGGKPGDRTLTLHVRLKSSDVEGSLNRLQKLLNHSNTLQQLLEELEN